ncbi:MAG: hypothetical protein WCS70_04795 [Verrucomicrobiota bacterium]
MNDFLQALKQPEYIHVLLNPLPVYGTAMGVLALIVALIFRSRGGQGIALVIIAVGCLSVWPVSEYGEKAADRVQSLSNSDGQKWLQEHNHRVDAVSWIFYVNAAISVAGLIALWKFPKLSAWLMLLALLAGLASLAAGGWISQAGGKIRHTEFRTGPPPEPAPEH